MCKKSVHCVHILPEYKIVQENYCMSYTKNCTRQYGDVAKYRKYSTTIYSLDNIIKKMKCKRNIKEHFAEIF